jgi:L-arabinose isomerase
MVESLPGEHILATYSHTIFRPEVPVKRLFEEIIKVGTTQHFAVVDGDYREELGLLCDMMGIEFHDIR